MNNLLAQIILAAGNDGAEWLQILVFVVVVSVYALGSILKAKANKLEEVEEEEQLPRSRPRRKPLEGARRIQPRPAGPVPTRQYRPQTPPTGRKIARPQQVAGKMASKKQKWAVEPLTLELSKKEAKELTAKPTEQKDATIVAETPQIQYLAEALLDYADPDELKRAILHYEILGKPLSLRSPSSDLIIGL